MNEEHVSLNSNELIGSQNVLVCYKGPFLERVLNIIGEKINTLFNENPRLNKKVFSIFIELAQNIAYYSEKRHAHEDGLEKTYGEGSFVISESKEFYTLTSSNLIKKSWEKEVVEKCDMINKLDTDGLRKLKRELRNRPRHEGQLGGNIGLVDIALKAGTSLNVDISSEDDQFSFFTLAIDVPKENQ